MNEAKLMNKRRRRVCVCCMYISNLCLYVVVKISER